ncbi:MAG: hypothetical protein ACO1RX_08235 [Candidatus Sericytochromatia bacterium]
MSFQSFLKESFAVCEQQLDQEHLRSQNLDGIELAGRLGEALAELATYLEHHPHSELHEEVRLWMQRSLSTPDAMLKWSRVEIFEAGYLLGRWETYQTP